MLCWCGLPAAVFSKASAEVIQMGCWHHGISYIQWSKIVI